MSLLPPVRITEAFVVRERPDVPCRDGRVCVETLEDLQYHVGSETSQDVIIVPAGFVTDFASIPPACWSLIGPPLGRHARAAIIHDYLYDTGGYGGRYTRARSDEIFLEAMAVLKVSWLKRSLMFRAVRIGGASGWRC